MRSVLFVDPPAFCTTVEGLVVPALRTRPVAVAPPGADRAVILALSSEARLAGVERGMPVRLALKRCPDLVLLPPNPRENKSSSTSGDCNASRASSGSYSTRDLLLKQQPTLQLRGGSRHCSMHPSPSMGASWCCATCPITTPARSS